MNFDDLIKIAGSLPYFTTGFLVAAEKPTQVRLQLARWVTDGRVVRIHKGVYVLAEPYRKIKPEPFPVANALKPASYVSLQSALSWYGLIPEFVPTVTNVTTGRPQTIETPLGRFEYRHIATRFFWGFQRAELAASQQAFVATPEKALLDLVYLTPGGDRSEFLEELRLQNMDKLKCDVLRQYAEKAGSPKLKRAVRTIDDILRAGEGIDL